MGRRLSVKSSGLNLLGKILLLNTKRVDLIFLKKDKRDMTNLAIFTRGSRKFVIECDNFLKCQFLHRLKIYKILLKFNVLRRQQKATGFARGAPLRN